LTNLHFFNQLSQHFNHLCIFFQRDLSGIAKKAEETAGNNAAKKGIELKKTKFNEQRIKNAFKHDFELKSTSRMFLKATLEFPFFVISHFLYFEIWFCRSPSGFRGQAQF